VANNIPTLVETTLGAFLHDIGKFWQRAHGAQRNADPEVRAMADYILPRYQDRPTHIHALWTYQFFHWMERQNLEFPGARRDRVRNIAAYHHRPGGGPLHEADVQWLVQEADHLAAGMDREKRRDQELESDDNRERYIKTALVSPFASVKLSDALGEVPRTYVALGKLAPGGGARSKPSVDTSSYQEEYKRLVESFQKEFHALCGVENQRVYLSALRSLCERYWHAVPSSTIDQPDVSLYDHCRAVAAVTSALYQWHAANGEISQKAIEATREAKKFRWILGDLSGIQSSLFRLQHQQVKGVAKILRARSYLMGLITETACLDALERLGLTPFSVIQNAGGRFLILAAATEQTERVIDQLRKDIETWMLRRWRGELALNLALSEPFGGEVFRRKHFASMQSLWTAAAEEAKHRAFSIAYQPVLRWDSYPYGPCSACGVRPAKAERDPQDPESSYCGPCTEERQLGGDLPKVTALTWARQPLGDSSRAIELWSGIWLSWHLGNLPRLNTAMGACSLWRDGLPSEAALAGVRFTANYVPRMTVAERDKRAYRRLSEEARQVPAGDLKLFEHLAADALEEVGDKLYGEDLLGVVKADVDRLGAIFAQGIESPSLGLIAGLSRMMDFFFTAELPEMLRAEERFHSTYVVYGGGDDLLLIGPWRQSLDLLIEIREQFKQWVGANPHISLSAALELVHPSEPLNRSVRHAEERLERAKDKGRNRVCAIDNSPLEWEVFRKQLEAAGELLHHMRDKKLSSGFVYRMLAFDRDRLACESDAADYHSASWRARWGYQLKRNLKREAWKEIAPLLNRLLGLDEDLGKLKGTPSARTALTVALYRNREF